MCGIVGLMNWRNNVSLIVGLSLPILMILFVAGSIYLPRMGKRVVPQYDFLYKIDQGDGAYTYAVKNGKLERGENVHARPILYDVGPDGNPVYDPKTPAQIDTTKLYTHDTDKNESREVSFEDAEKLALDSRGMSPDGFEVAQQSGSNGIFTDIFGGGSRDYNSRYLTGHGRSEKLNLENNSQNGYYYYNFQFLGWINK